MGSQRRVDPADRFIVDTLRAAATGGFVSGAALATDLGVSRAAVGKRVGLLRDQGFQIAAVPHRGYRLIEEPDGLSPLVIEGRLASRWLGHDYRFRESVGSTNEELARLAWRDRISRGSLGPGASDPGGTVSGGGPPEHVAHGTVLVADRQEHGRGRLGRVWASPEGKNIYLSALLRPAWSPQDLPPLTLAVAVGVANALEPFLGWAPVVKWPNDLLAPDGRKICGILAELSAEFDRLHHIIVGVGLNVNQTRFPRALASRATSLRREAGRVFSRAEVLVAILETLEPWLDALLVEGDAGRDRVLDAWLDLADSWLG
ncbi:MAG: biotin--[acetyl-CoA-carboxylase] ligase, partial [Deltaproteobacteria bacterium]|nr:biotin--[acetyl-CoA-carboxylase] ligase [Deltaproteobacteria bacterium]